MKRNTILWSNGGAPGSPGEGGAGKPPELPSQGPAPAMGPTTQTTQKTESQTTTRTTEKAPAQPAATTQQPPRPAQPTQPAQAPQAPQTPKAAAQAAASSEDQLKKMLMEATERERMLADRLEKLQSTNENLSGEMNRLIKMIDHERKENAAGMQNLQNELVKMHGKKVEQTETRSSATEVHTPAVEEPDETRTATQRERVVGAQPAAAPRRKFSWGTALVVTLGILGVFFLGVLLFDDIRRRDKPVGMSDAIRKELDELRAKVAVKASAPDTNLPAIVNIAGSTLQPTNQSQLIIVPRAVTGTNGAVINSALNTQPIPNISNQSGIVAIGSVINQYYPPPPAGSNAVCTIEKTTTWKKAPPKPECGKPEPYKKRHRLKPGQKCEIELQRHTNFRYVTDHPDFLEVEYNTDANPEVWHSYRHNSGRGGKAWKIRFTASDDAERDVTVDVEMTPKTQS